MRNPDPSAYLPHCNPFLFLDRLLSCEAGTGAAAIKRVTDADCPFPQVLLVEAMAQLAGVAVGGQEGEGGFLAAIDHAEFSGVPLPGDALLVSVSVVKSFGRLHLISGEVAVDGRVLAAATLTLGIGRV